jgi:hypothetical protein
MYVRNQADGYHMALAAAEYAMGWWWRRLVVTARTADSSFAFALRRMTNLEESRGASPAESKRGHA